MLKIGGTYQRGVYESRIEKARFMNKFDQITSIHKSLSGQLSVVEQQRLNEWLLANPEHKAIAQEVEMIWEGANSQQESESIDVENALARFKKARVNQEAEVPRITSEPQKVAKSISLRRYFLRAAVAAGFLFGMFFLFSEMGQDVSNGLATVSTSFGEKDSANLEDGSSVYVNSETVFEYPNRFDENSREVNLKGEAFFDVAKDAERPFLIGTDQLSVKVLGTSFNVYAYPGKATEEVVVATGKVAVTVKEKNKEYILEAGDYLSYNHQDGKVVIKKDRKQNAQAWRTGVLTFDATPLVDVCQTLEKHFDIAIAIKNLELLNCSVTVPSFKNANQEIVLETLKTVFSMELEQTGKQSFEFSGGTCN